MWALVTCWPIPKPKHAYLFAKIAFFITGLYDTVVLPRATAKVDWEGEFGPGDRRSGL